VEIEVYSSALRLLSAFSSLRLLFNWDTGGVLGSIPFGGVFVEGYRCSRVGKKDGPVSGNFKSPNVLRGSLGLFPGEWERTDERSRKRSYFGRKEKEEIQLL